LWLGKRKTLLLLRLKLTLRIADTITRTAVGLSAPLPLATELSAALTAVPMTVIIRRAITTSVGRRIIDPRSTQTQSARRQKKRLSASLMIVQVANIIITALRNALDSTLRSIIETIMT
jgi:hypothetical protein